MVKTLDKRSKKLKKSVDVPIISEQGLKYFRWILLAALAAIIFYPPFLRGLYFEEEQLPTEILVFIVFTAFWVYKTLKKDKRFLETPLDYAAITFTAIYLISMITAVTLRGAVNEWLKYCMYFAVFFMLSELANTYRSRMGIIWVLVASALGLSLIGIDGAAGAKAAAILNTFFKKVRLLDNFFLIFGEDREVLFGLFVGDRINSTLQYPNALASYLLAAYFVTLGIMTASKNIGSRLIAGASSYILLITFILTMSRGVYLLMPVAAVLFLLLLPKGSRPKGVSYAFASLVGVGATVIRLSEYMANNEGNKANIWKYILIGTLVALVCTFIINYVVRWLERLNWKVYLCIGVAIVLAVIGGIVAAITLKGPLELSSAEESVRRSFYVEPEKEYRLTFNVEATGDADGKNAYRIIIASRDFAGTINSIDTPIATVEGQATNGVEEREIVFKAPLGSRTASVTFSGQAPGAKVVFHEAKIAPVDLAGKEKSIALKYKFIPESFYSRYDDAKETRSAIERTIFYKDGFKAIADGGHWVIGAGGGAWPLLYFGYQSYLYWTTQAHTYIVQIGLECGIIGFAALVLLIAALAAGLANELRRRKQEDVQNSVMQAAVFTAIAMMLLHSFMDFDLSLSAVFLLLWELLALFNARLRSNSPGDEENAEKTDSSWSRFLAKMDVQKRIRKQRIYPAVGIGVMVILFVLPVTLLSGKINAEKAKSYYSDGNLSNALKFMQKAAQADGMAAEYKIDYANMLLKQEQNSINQKDFIKANKFAAQSEKAAEHSPELALKVGAYYFSTGNIDKGLHYIGRAAELRPLRPEEWQQKADAYMQIAMLYLQKGEDKKAEEHLDEVLKIVDTVKEVNERNRIPFILNAPTQEIIEKARFFKNSVEEGKEVNLEKMVFYSMNDMDVNSDGRADQWETGVSQGVKLSTANGSMLLEGKSGSVQSRLLNLKEGKLYRIEVELVNAQGVNSIPFAIPGVSEKNEGLNPVGGVYTADVATPQQFAKENNRLVLGFDGKYEIKSVKVMER